LDGEGGGVAADSAVGGVAAGGTVSWASSAAGYGGLVKGRFATNADAGAVGNEAVGVAGGTRSANTVLIEPISSRATLADCCRCAGGRTCCACSANSCVRPISYSALEARSAGGDGCACNASGSTG